MAKRKRFPQEILVYLVEESDGVPIYGIALNVSEIPEDSDGEVVGVYTLSRVDGFCVRRELKSIPR